MSEKKRKVILTGDRPTGRLIMNVTLDYLSAGIDPEKAHILIQSQIPELPELTQYYMNLVTVQRLQRNPTVKAEIKLRGFSEHEESQGTPVGFFCYPISQAADITAFRATVVPAGEDQEPMVEQTREIVRKFNSIYGETLVEPEILLPKSAASRRLPGTDGKAKMSKSLGNCIYLSDDEKTVKTKVMSMFTDPGHLKVDVKVKKFLNNVLEETLRPIRARRAEYEKDLQSVIEILKDGTKYAENIAAQTLSDVKKSMQINYFSA